uniref:hypothetical protein n=1 Tax=Haloprofundus sp. MHR1 TaxID=2572921 RepID=UPI001F44490E|nr:hypothetical protein [Haloprofundus sp. MHR1]
MKLHFPNDNLFLYRESASGGNDLLAISTSGFSLSEDAWYRVEIDWTTRGRHEITVYDDTGNSLTSVAAKDLRWTSGGIGFYAYVESGGSAYYDHVVISQKTVMGKFEADMNGWSPNGSSTLSRSDRSIESAPVTQRDYALKVNVNGDSEPSIQNRQRIYHSDLSNNTCLIADVLPASVENSDSPVTFRFRYHHTNGIEKSNEITVDQGCGAQVAWDLDELSSSKLDSPERIELVWYPENHPPSSNFDYNGVVYVDNIRLTNNKTDVTHASCAHKTRALQRAHGACVEETVDAIDSSTQSGEFVYSDGTRVPYSGEILADGSVEMTIDGEAFRYWGDDV